MQLGNGSYLKLPSYHHLIVWAFVKVVSSTIDLHVLNVRRATNNLMASAYLFAKPDFLMRMVRVDSVQRVVKVVKTLLFAHNVQVSSF
jgi:hypothetical protein